MLLASTASKWTRVAIDLRGLAQAIRNSPDGALGGPGRYADGLVRALLQRTDGIQYDLLVDRRPLPDPIRALEDAARIVPVGPSAALLSLRRARIGPLFDIAAQPQLRKQLMRHRPDVIHYLDQWGLPVRGIGLVVTLHDLYALAPSAQRNQLDKLMLRRLMLRADAVACVSKATAADAMSMLGISSERLHVISPGVDTTLFRPGGDATETKRYILHVGVLRDRKNPEGVLRTFADVARELPDLHLLCVGPYNVAPAALARITKLADELEISDRVEIREGPDDRTLAELYRGAAALLFPSFHEGFGLPVVEALASGVPCVISNSSSLPEVGGDLAVEADPTDLQTLASALRRVLADHELRRRLQTSGPAWAERFSWDRAAESFVELYLRSA